MKKLLVFLLAIVALMGSAAAFDPSVSLSGYSHYEDCCASTSGYPSLDFYELGPEVKSTATHVTCEFGVCEHTNLYGLNFNKDNAHYVDTNAKFGVNKGQCDTCGQTKKVKISYPTKTSSCD